MNIVANGAVKSPSSNSVGSYLLYAVPIAFIKILAYSTHSYFLLWVLFQFAADIAFDLLAEIKTQSIDLPEVVNFGSDTRRQITATTDFPHNAVARMIMTFFSNASRYGGTGFLTEDYIFITAAHNVRDSNNGNHFANRITLWFGLDGDMNRGATKAIELNGQDFTVPSSYQEATDWCDVAWVDLKKYVADKLVQNKALSWGVDDLPTDFFHKCKIPDQHGALNGNFTICGKYKSILFICY